MISADDRRGQSPAFAAAAMDDLSKAKDTVTRDAKHLADRVKDEVLHQAEDVKEEIRERAEQGQSVAAESLGAFAEAIRKANDELKEKGPTAVTNLIGEVVNGLEGFSRVLGQRSLEDTLGAVRSFGKSNPGAFVAGSVLAGVALGRFAKSSAKHAAETSKTEGQSFTGANEPVFDERFDRSDDLLSQLAFDHQTADIDDVAADADIKPGATPPRSIWSDRND